MDESGESDVDGNPHNESDTEMEDVLAGKEFAKKIPPEVR
jgi:hypothetical protein